MLNRIRNFMYRIGLGHSPRTRGEAVFNEVLDVLSTGGGTTAAGYTTIPDTGCPLCIAIAVGSHSAVRLYETVNNEDD